MLSELLSKKNKIAAGRIVERAFKIVRDDSGHRAAVKENRLIDIAYRLDIDLPMKLALLYDDDPARDEYKERAQNQLAAHDLKRTLGDYRNKANLNEIRDDAKLANAAWRALGALNSGRMVATDMARLREMLMCASNYPLKTSYPMYSWVLTNATMKYASTPEASTYLRNMFEGIFRGAKFLVNLGNPELKHSQVPAWRDIGDSESQIVIQSGEEERAFLYLHEWIEKNGEDELIIMDPYFNSTDLPFLVEISRRVPWLRICIVTGRLGEKDTNGSLPNIYREAWRNLCDHSPPKTEVLVVGMVNHRSPPFHDRWILSQSAGIHLGTSIGGLGKRDSSITALNGDDLAKVHAIVWKYRSLEVREIDGEGLSYQLFELSAQ